VTNNEEQMDQPLILTVAIIGGTGNLGPGLALRLTDAGYRVVIGSRQDEKAKATAKDLNEKLDVKSIQGMENSEAVKTANICVMTVVASAHQEALESLKDDLQGKVLIDTTARVDVKNLKPPQSPSAARHAQDYLGSDVKVAAAFQNVPHHVLYADLEDSLEMDVFVFADDPETAKEATLLVEAAGMDAYFAGDLDSAIIAEGLTALLIAVNRRYKSKGGGIKLTGIEK
jgi:NADPH-dependent F420 reductase